MGYEGPDDAVGHFMTIEVCAALSDRVIREKISLAKGSQLQQIRQLLEGSGELATAWDQAAGFSVFGEKRAPQSLLEEGDRVEILRPLRADPKEARRQRAKLKMRPV